jgi:hypothetical protein
MMRGTDFYRSIVLLVIVAVLAGCDWFEDPVEANLPPETELLDCVTAQGVTEGDDVRFTWSGSDIDGRVSGYEVSFDDGPWEATLLESLTVSDVSRGDHLFAVRAIDDDGDVDPDPAQCAFTARVAGQTVERAVLVELFTTNTCPSCPKAETALKALLAEMGGEALSLVAYHDKPTDAPDSDALATDQTDGRIAWYTENPSFPGETDTWPTVVFDGLRIVEGALTAEQAEANYRLEIATRAETASAISLHLDGEIEASEGTVDAVVRAEDVPPEGDLVLRLVLIESDVKYRGYFATRFDFVARLLMEDEALNLSAVGDSVSVERQFEVDPSWVLENLDVIAFIQDTGTMEVIQSGRLNSD